MPDPILDYAEFVGELESRPEGVSPLMWCVGMKSRLPALWSSWLLLWAEEQRDKANA